MQTSTEPFAFLKEDLNAPVGSLTCKLFRETHPNCLGCEHEKACKEYVKRTFQYVLQINLDRGLITEQEAERFDRSIKEDEMQ